MRGAALLAVPISQGTGCGSHFQVAAAGNARCRQAHPAPARCCAVNYAAEAKPRPVKTGSCSFHRCSPWGLESSGSVAALYGVMLRFRGTAGVRPAAPLPGLVRRRSGDAVQVRSALAPVRPPASPAAGLPPGVRCAGAGHARDENGFDPASTAGLPDRCGVRAAGGSAGRTRWRADLGHFVEGASRRCSAVPGGRESLLAQARGLPADAGRPPAAGGLTKQPTGLHFQARTPGRGPRRRADRR